MPTNADLVEIQDPVALGMPADRQVRGNIAGVIAGGLEQRPRLNDLAFRWLIPEPAGVNNRALEIHFPLGVWSEGKRQRLLRCQRLVRVPSRGEDQPPIGRTPQRGAGGEYLGTGLEDFLQLAALLARDEDPGFVM